MKRLDGFHFEDGLCVGVDQSLQLKPYQKAPEITVRERILDELKNYNDEFDSWNLNEDQARTMCNGGYGEYYGIDFFAWGKKRVYFPAGDFVVSAPRNPESK